MIDSIRKERALQTSDLRPIAINNGIASPTTLSFACFQWRLPVCPLQRADFAAHRRAGPIMTVAESAAASSLFTATVETSSLPPMHVLQTRLFIVVSVFAAAWMVCSLVLKIMSAIWGWAYTRVFAAGSVRAVEQRLLAAVTERRLAERRESELKELLANLQLTTPREQARQRLEGLAQVGGRASRNRGEVARMPGAADRDFGTVGDAWVMVKGPAEDQEYERYALRTGDTLLRTASSQSLVSNFPSPGVGKCAGRIGHWDITYETAALIKVSHGMEQFYLLPDGCAFLGESDATRGVLVRAHAHAPLALPRDQLREEIGCALDQRQEPAAGAQGISREEERVDDRLAQVMRRTNRVAKAMLTERQKEPAEAVPKELTCGLTGELMHDPWIASDGFSYERQAILQWFETRGSKSPATGRAMDVRLVPNNALKAIIDAFKQA